MTSCRGRTSPRGTPWRCASSRTTYTLYVNGESTGRTATFTVDRPAAGQLQKPSFVKTSGTYRQEGELGQGTMLFNIKISTSLNQYNEYVVYDTPDVNQVMSDYFRVFLPAKNGELNNEIDLDDNGVYVEPASSDPNEDTRMEMYLYDIYFVTEESQDVSDPRQAGYHEETLAYDRRNSYDGTPYTESMDPAAVPNNILFEVPAGSELTAEQEQMIEDAGGLNKTVGKGFKFRIKNFKSPHFSEGGFITLVYRTTIVNPSPSMTSDGMPIYYNTASFYAQEIPNCDPDDDGSRGEVAVAKDGTRLEGLVTNDKGELCVAAADGSAGEPVALRLVRGNYFFVETAVPEGYEMPQGDDAETLVTVGLIGNDVIVYNVAEPEPEPEPDSDHEPEPDPEPEPETILPTAFGLVAYEGGLGSHENPETGDALPEPVWRAQWEGWTVYVDGEEWDVDAKGMPFRWGYFAQGETDPNKAITSAAGRASMSSGPGRSPARPR